MVHDIVVRRALTAVILAGGRGTRISDLFPDIPKPLVPAMGQPFLFWVISWLARQGLNDIVLSIGHLSHTIEDWVAGAALPQGVQLRCKRETSQLGTGGGVRHCLDLCGEFVLVANGDSLVASDLTPHIERMISDSLDALVFGVEVADASRYGTLVTTPEGELLDFAEKRSGAGLVNAGVYLFRRVALEGWETHKPLSMEHDVIPGLLRAGCRMGAASLGKCSFLDIGTPESVIQASSFIEANLTWFAD